jgi:hypothetical protein
MSGWRWHWTKKRLDCYWSRGDCWMKWRGCLGTCCGTSRQCRTVCCYLSLLNAGTVWEERWGFPKVIGQCSDFGRCTVGCFGFNFGCDEWGCVGKCLSWFGAVIVGCNEFIVGR